MSNDNYCPYCGSLAKAGDAFCNNCGASIVKATATPSPGFSTPQQPDYTVKPQPQQVYVSPQQQYTYGTSTTYQPPVPVQKSNGAAITSFVLAISSIVISFIPYVSVITPILIIAAFILGIIGLKNPYQKGFAIAGLVISSCAIALFVLVLLLFIPLLFNL